MNTVAGSYREAPNLDESSRPPKKVKGLGRKEFKKMKSFTRNFNTFEAAAFVVEGESNILSEAQARNLEVLFDYNRQDPLFKQIKDHTVPGLTNAEKIALGQHNQNVITSALGYTPDFSRPYKMLVFSQADAEKDNVDFPLGKAVSKVQVDEAAERGELTRWNAGDVRVYIESKDDDGNSKLLLIFAARFNNQSDFIGFDKEDFEFLVPFFSEHVPKMCSVITTNGAANIGTDGKRETDGDMRAIGWRSGTDSGASCGTYSQHKKSTVKKMNDHTHKAECCGTIFCRRFTKFCPQAAARNIELATQFNMPSVTEQNKYSTGVSMFGNITCTCKGKTGRVFCNKCHKDKDLSGAYTFGIWFDLWFGKALPPGFKTPPVGAYFLLPALGLFIDFDLCDGFVEIMWQGSSSAHVTTGGEIGQDFDRIGTSAQLAKKLMFGAGKVVDEDGNINHSRINSASVRRDKEVEALQMKKIAKSGLISGNLEDLTGLSLCLAAIAIDEGTLSVDLEDHYRKN